MAEAMETQAPYPLCFVASDPVVSAEVRRKILAIGLARPFSPCGSAAQRMG